MGALDAFYKFIERRGMFAPELDLSRVGDYGDGEEEVAPLVMALTKDHSPARGELSPDCAKTVELLLQNRAGAEATASDGSTIPSQTTLAGIVDAKKLLVRFRANANKSMEGDRSPLGLAVGRAALAWLEDK